MPRDGEINGDGNNAGAAGRPSVSALTPKLQLRRPLGLPGKLLILTSLFVMLSEILIFVPSLANFRVNWLSDRINAAHLAALAADSVPGGAVPTSLRMELLATAQVKGIAIRRAGQRRMVLPPDDLQRMDATYDLRPMASSTLGAVGERLAQITDAATAFTVPSDWVMRVLGQPIGSIGVAAPFAYRDDDFVEILLPAAPLRAAMIRYALNILLLSVIISVITAALVYMALSGLLVRPMMRLAQNMMHFSEKPDDPMRIIVPSDRTDEIGTTERELARMQTELVNLIQQKNRLAELGLAVSKINHDLRNMLATAQLMSDRLAALPDPAVQRFSPKLIASLDRAINFCNDTLNYGRAEESAPKRTRFALGPLVEEVGDGLGLPREDLNWYADVDGTLVIDADRDHLYRVLNNLVRNSIQAIEASPSRRGTVTVTAARDGPKVGIVVGDDGPGVPEKALANLFQAFKGGARKGGSGLGLAISSELVAAMGGTLRYEAGEPGARFTLDVPDRAPAARPPESNSPE